jgi:hypothetical protein
MNPLNREFTKIALLVLTSSTLLFTACDKDDEDPQNEQELITTVKLTFTAAGGSAQSFLVKDLDGDGGNPPVQEEIVLSPLTTYNLAVEFLDESDASHSHNLTEEVEAEKADHLICFELGTAFTSQTITDFDNLGKPLGLTSTIMTGPAGTGALKVTLKHEPDKSAATPCTTGETDVSVEFPVKVE